MKMSPLGIWGIMGRSQHNRCNKSFYETFFLLPCIILNNKFNDKLNFKLQNCICTTGD